MDEGENIPAWASGSNGASTRFRARKSSTWSDKEEYGSADALKLEAIDKPILGKGDVLLRDLRDLRRWSTPSSVEHEVATFGGG